MEARFKSVLKLPDCGRKMTHSACRCFIKKIIELEEGRLMDKESLLALLQENLTVEVSKDYPYDPFGTGSEPNVTVKIRFAGKLVAEDTE